MLANYRNLRNFDYLNLYKIKHGLKVREVTEHQVDRSQFRVQSRSNSELNSKSLTRRSLSFKQSIPIVNKPKNTNQSLDRTLANLTSQPFTVSDLEKFESSPFPLQGSYLSDLGVVDANNDNIFDIFTTNHHSLQSLSLGSASGPFTDVLNQWRLSQDRQFPGFENFQFSPPSDTPGLYIYRSNPRTLNFRLQPGKNIRPAVGEMIVSSPEASTKAITILKKQRAKVRISDLPLEQGSRTRIQFEVRPNGRFTLDTRFPDLPYRVNLVKPFPLKQVDVGANRIHPRTNKFTLQLRDRHSMAWADYQGDNRIDVFIARGGLRGKILDFNDPDIVTDELFTNKGNGIFKDQAADLGFSKQGCRARKVEWVDFNQDDRLDLYISGLKSPNQLFQQQPNGRFKNVAAEQGLNFRNYLQFEWLDADSDGDQDLLLADKGRLQLYINQNIHQTKRFKSRQTISISGLDPRKLAIADFDQDGDLDVYVASPQSSTLLINTGGRYTAANPETIGLPTQALTANWVDYDNDGLLDLHTLPGGLYHQLPSHQFVATQALRDIFANAPAISEDSEFNNARCTWFDLDNNGTRDVLCAAKLNVDWQTTLYRNRAGQNRWLQVKLIGSKKNRNAIGAKVIVTTSAGQQLQQIGSAEGSHLSQGHYRLYFGLGQSPVVDSVQVIWPNGRQQELRSVGADQLLTVQYS